MFNMQTYLSKLDWKASNYKHHDLSPLWISDGEPAGIDVNVISLRVLAGY